MRLFEIITIIIFAVAANCQDVPNKKVENFNLEITYDTTTTEPSTTPTTPASTNTTTSSTVPTSPETSTKPTTSAPTTSAPTTTVSTTTTSSTEAPKPSHKCPQFSFLSFIGGIIMTIGLAFIGGLVFKFYKARTERNYHTL